MIIRVILALGFFAATAVSPARAEEAPPIAAPTNPVAVTALPVVRSASQQVDDFSSGLLQGLSASEAIPGLALIVVERDHVMVQKSLGVADRQSLTPINGDTVFPMGSLAGAVIGLAAMQQVEQAQILLTDDAGTLLDDNDWRGVTVAQLLTHRVAGADEALAGIVARRSGQAIGPYVESRIFVPLGMAHSHFEGGNFTTTASDMGRLLIALLGDGITAPRIFAPETIALLTRTHVTAHQALAGWTYVFAEMRRGGWRALQYDGMAGDIAARLVFEPETGLGYFMVVNRNTGAEFWQVADNSLFDRVLPPRGANEGDLRDVPAPTADMARDVAGTYVVERGPEAEVLFLKTPRGRLRVDARDDGALVFSGVENAVLLPQPGGYWRSDEMQINAAVGGGKLLLDQHRYDRFRLWERPIVYAWLALFFAFSSAALMLQPQRASALVRLDPRHMVYAAPALLAVALLLLTTAVILRRLAFVP